MTNTKHLIHRTLDIGSGLVLSIIIQLTIFPFYGIYIEVWAMLHLAIIFMVVSIIRSYLWSKYVFKYGEKTLVSQRYHLYQRQRKMEVVRWSMNIKL